MTTKITYYSDCKNQRSLTAPLLNNGVKMKVKGFFGNFQDSNSFNSVGFGLKKSRYGKSLIYCDDSSKLFDIEKGYVGIVLKLPDKIVNGIYLPLLENDTNFNEHLIWGVNVGKMDVSLPSISAKFTTTGIDFTIWASNGKFSMKDVWSNVEANADMFMEFIWSNEGVDDFGINDFDARMVFRLNEEAVVIANTPTREKDSNSIEGLNFCLLDTPYIYSNIECIIKKIIIADGLPQSIEEDLRSSSSSTSSSSEGYSSSSSSEGYSSSSSSEGYSSSSSSSEGYSESSPSSLNFCEFPTCVDTSGDADIYLTNWHMTRVREQDVTDNKFYISCFEDMPFSFWKEIIYLYSDSGLTNPFGWAESIGSPSAQTITIYDWDSLTEIIGYVDWDGTLFTSNTGHVDCGEEYSSSSS